MTTDETLAAVRPLIGTRWGYADDYAAFIGPRCPACSARGCTSPACLAAVRADVQGVLTVGDLAAVLCGPDSPDLSPSAEEIAAEEAGGVTDAF